jgi:hypothetical protein
MAESVPSEAKNDVFGMYYSSEHFASWNSEWKKCQRIWARRLASMANTCPAILYGVYSGGHMQMLSLSEVYRSIE